MGYLGRPLLASLLMGVALAGCGQTEPDPVTNSVLARPTDVALSCLNVNCAGSDEPGKSCRTSMVSLDQCGLSNVISRNTCSPSGDDNKNYLVGFVTNSETNEVALFTQCRHGRGATAGDLAGEGNGVLVDMDPESPGFNFVPVGGMPLEMTSDGPTTCQVTTANAATCDFSVLDAEALAGYAFGIRAEDEQVAEGGEVPPPAEAGEGSEGEEAAGEAFRDLQDSDGPTAGRGSALVRRLTPLRFDDTLAEPDWVPLGLSPAAIVSTPRGLTECRNDLIGDTSGATGTCTPGRAGSVIATFPSCDLVAEIDLATGRIVQSMVLEVDENGVVDATLTGSSPECAFHDCSVEAIPQTQSRTATEELSFRSDGLAGDNDKLPVEELAELLASRSLTHRSRSPGGARRGLAPIALALSTDDELRWPGTVELGPNGELVDDASLVCESGGRIQRNRGTLYVGGAGSERLVSVRIEAGEWLPEIGQLELSGARSISRIRVVPPAYEGILPEPGTEKNDTLDGVRNFLYVIAGDASTRVVLRNMDAEDGIDHPLDHEIECDAQIDTHGEVNLPLCTPITPGVAGVPLNRRALARGPGIRGPRSSRILDWSFMRVVNNESFNNAGGVRTKRYFSDRVFGVGTTSSGAMVYTGFGQFAKAGGRPFDYYETNEEGKAVPASINTALVGTHDFATSGTPPSGEIFDPARLIPLALAPHSLDTQASLILPSAELDKGIPVVANTPPTRAIARGSNLAAELSPTLRLVDSAYAYREPEEFASPLQQIADEDKLGPSPEDTERLYNDDVVRVMARDYRSWLGGTWHVEWEGPIEGTASTRGRIECENGAGAGVGPDTKTNVCLPDSPGGSRLVDDTEDFCQKGVLPGDRLVLLGCLSDDQCGVGQRCLIDDGAFAQGSGICISDRDFDTRRDELIAACGEFLDDPCGEYFRHYEITRATRTTLELGVLPRRMRSHIREEDNCDGQGRHNHFESGQCVCDEGYIEGDAQVRAFFGFPSSANAAVKWCFTEAEVMQAQSMSSTELGLAGVFDRRETIDRYVCSDNQPDGGCANDSDCALPELSGEFSAYLRQLEAGTVAGATDAEKAAGAAANRLLNRVCEDRRCRRPCLSEAEIVALQTPLPSQNGGQSANQLLAANIPGFVAPTKRDRCVQRLLPGEMCFPELLSYEIRAGNSFVVRGTTSTTRFFTDQVTTNEAGECVQVAPEAGVSTLLTSRIPLGPDGDHLDLPECPEGDIVGPRDPNPCLVTAPRVDSSGSTATAPQRFSALSYGTPDNQVKSVRFSNPIFSLQLDLTSLGALLRPVRSGGLDLYWPPSAAKFQRARIPRGYAMAFATASSEEQLPRADGLILDPLGNGARDTIPVTQPIRIVKSPFSPYFYVVDGSGLSVGGQVVRVNVGWQNFAEVDPNFNGVH